MVCSNSSYSKIATVIIPVRSDKRLGSLLEALSKQTMPRNEFEVLVVENGSTVFEELVNAHGAEYYHLEHASIPAARNLGLSRAVGRFALFTDADCIPSVDWIRNLVDFLEDRPRLAGCGGPIHRYNPKSPVQKYGSNLVWGQTELNYLLPVTPFPYVVTANAAFKLERIEEIGGFDEELSSGSDVDLCHRLGLRGNQISICPSALISHDNRSSVRGHFLRFFRYATYQTLLYKKHRSGSHTWVSVNPYPYECLRRSLSGIWQAGRSLLQGDSGPLWSCFLLAVEGLATLAGGLYGAFRFRVAYF